ncbi:hypothetical protein VTN77DRAFT_9796 [Rasamsonia byssochlamydoides]|uniref:uncharacterized protein n=1 Tax=Rasamsonia byssochlamydoides TaxID=89139 RepID=UPI0037420DD6
MTSSPSTPRSTRSASPGNDDSPQILTPGRKIKAMLAAFDSDSDSDNGVSITIPRPSIAKSKLSPGRRSVSSNEEDDDDDDENIIVPRGRMAARMQAEKPRADEGETAYERVARRLHAQLQETQPPETQQEDSSAQSSEDELPATGFRRRLLKRRKPSDVDEKSDRSRSRERSVSPLFVSSPNRDHEETPVPDEDEDRLEPRLKPNSRFLALVEQKRKEREERERIEAEKKAARAEQMKEFSSEILSDEGSDDEAGSGRKLTKQSRPTRKASKKAIEEMNRETQRMSRNMQLAHQAKTKKKITKESFFARFNFMQPQGPQKSETTAAPSSSSAPSSDAEGQNEKTTPPTSPIRDCAVEIEKSHPVAEEQREEGCDLPSVEEIMTQPPAPQEPVTVGRVEVPEPTPAPEPTTSKPKPERKPLTKPPVRVRMSRQDVAQHQKEDSDSDLEVVTSPAKCRRIAAFENLPARQAQEPASLLKLKALAHLTSPTRRSTSMTPAELSATLRLQARQQAAKEREERIQELRARGIIIETAEERAAMEDDVEDLMEKARKEAEEIARREKAARGKDQGNDIDSEEDEDYERSGSEEVEGGDEANDEEEEEEEEVEEEEENEEDDEEEVEGDEENEDLVEEEAVEADESEDERTETMSSDAESEVPAPTGPRKRRIRVISDDEDEDEEQEVKTLAKSVAGSSDTPKRPQFPDMPSSNGLTMGLTQAFAGTLADSLPDNEEDSLKMLRTLPDPGLPVAEVLEADSQVIVKDSQEQRRGSIDLLAGYTQSDNRVSESPAPHTWSQVSQIPDPTQDVGFVLSPFDQTKRFLDPPASTVDTVLLESPAQNKRGRLLRRGRDAQQSDAEDDGFEIKASAFDVMRKAAKKKSAVPFDKSKSKAKEHIDEAAEESEDEYAGLGGASDDSSGEEDEEDRAMINDDSGEVVDEKQLAALNADHQRAMDEKQVAKLLKDITSGALRRRRGADDDLDLDDSEDERMARRREKRREFAKMRKALLADEKVGEIASNPKTQAFFKSIEDRDSEDDMDLDFLDEGPSSQDQSSQDIQQQLSENDTAASGSSKRKRPLEPSAADVANRPPAKLRRTAASAVSRKPTTLAEIRESLYFLIEKPEYDSFHEDASMEEEEPADLDNAERPSHEDENANLERRTSADGFTIPPNPRRTRGRVVDRLALLRAASSNSASSNGKAAFQSASTTDAIPKIGIRPPPLLRRTITSSSSSSSFSSTSSASGSTTRTTTGPPLGASNGKKGAVNYYTAARERERERELRAKQRGGGSNIAALLSKQRAAGSGLGALMGQGQWE